MRALIVAALLAAALLLTPVSVVAHSGGTDANGCHAGTEPHHCHNGDSEGGSGGGGGSSDALVGVAAAVMVGWAVWHFCIRDEEPKNISSVNFSSKNSLVPAVAIDTQAETGGVTIGLKYKF